MPVCGPNATRTCPSAEASNRPVPDPLAFYELMKSRSWANSLALRSELLSLTPTSRLARNKSLSATPVRTSLAPSSNTVTSAIMNTLQFRGLAKLLPVPSRFATRVAYSRPDVHSARLHRDSDALRLVIPILAQDDFRFG